jgi:hypothetical protein
MSDRAGTLEDRVESLARELADTINEAEAPGRPGIRNDLRDVAISVLQDVVVPLEPEPVSGPATADASFNPLGMAIPMLLAGVVLLFLFPPVGLFLLAAAAVMIVWGLITSLWSRR